MSFLPSNPDVLETFDEFKFPKSYAESVDKTLYEKRIVLLRTIFLCTYQLPEEPWTQVQCNVQFYCLLNLSQSFSKI